jgi:hypothetical protein
MGAALLPRLDRGACFTLVAAEVKLLVAPASMHMDELLTTRATFETLGSHGAQPRKPLNPGIGAGLRAIGRGITQPEGRHFPIDFGKS